jgi:hypothetical protein
MLAAREIGARRGVVRRLPPTQVYEDLGAPKGYVPSFDIPG